MVEEQPHPPSSSFHVMIVINHMPKWEW
jgi:hypothetical protein